MTTRLFVLAFGLLACVVWAEPSPVAPMNIILILSLALVITLLLLCLYEIGKGWLGEPWSSAPVVDGPRPMSVQNVEQASKQPQILFGDLHNHTNYFLDAYLFNTNLVKGGGITSPADACDFARYCSALDFWSINDHAESLTTGRIRAALPEITGSLLRARQL